MLGPDQFDGSRPVERQRAMSMYVTQRQARGRDSDVRTFDSHPVLQTVNKHPLLSQL